MSHSTSDLILGPWKTELSSKLAPAARQDSSINLTGGQIELKDKTNLLETLMSRLNEDYRKIRLVPQKSSFASYEPRVSFDTINNEYLEDDTFDYSDEELLLPDPVNRTKRFSMEADYRGRGRDRDMFVRSPSASPSRMASPLRNVDISMFLSMNQLPYPTSPIVSRKGCTFTRMHKDFENLYLGRLLEKGLCPVLPGRVILVYVSGRMHTWVSIDWILRSFIQHGDTVVLVSSLPHSLTTSNKRLSRYSSPSKYPPMTEKMRQRQRNHPQYIKQVATNIMNYALSVIDLTTITKVIVEIAEGKTKNVLKDMYKLYEPNIVSTGSKINARNSAPLKSWNSSRLSDRLVKNFPIPVIVVPALNMSFYERVLTSQLLAGVTKPPESSNSASKRSQDEANEPSEGYGASASVDLCPSESLDSNLTPTATKSIHTNLYTSDEESFSDESVKSDLSTNSETSNESASSFHEIADLYDDYQREVHRELKKLAAAQVDENYFANFMRAISDQSLRFCEDLRSVNPNFTGKGAKLAHIITGSNSYGVVPYKTKSMLPPVNNLDANTGKGGIPIADLKKSLKLNARKARMEKEQNLYSNDVPQIRISGGDEIPPCNRSLKFEEDERRSSRSGFPRPLKKYLSHEDAPKLKPKLEPTKSHPDIRTMGGVEEQKVNKKKKKFWSLFK